MTTNEIIALATSINRSWKLEANAVGVWTLSELLSDKWETGYKADLNRMESFLKGCQFMLIMKRS
jgi:hypothetical protein